MSATKATKRRGPAPERLKIDMNWEQAVQRVMQRPATTGKPQAAKQVRRKAKA